MANFKLPYRRPKTLTDPYHDYTPQTLNRLLATPDAKLDWSDLQKLLGPFLPAGTYEESAYFYPFAFDRVLKHDDEAFDLQASLIWFASEYWDQIKNDGAGESIRQNLADCLEQWTRSFSVVHYDDAQCREKGWDRNYFDLVWMSENVIEYLNDLIRFESHSDLAFTFVDSLSQPCGDPIKSAWFLELARAHVGRDVYRPNNKQIQLTLDNEQLATEHSIIVTKQLESFSDTPTYWRDALSLLSIPIQKPDG